MRRPRACGGLEFSGLTRRLMRAAPDHDHADLPVLTDRSAERIGTDPESPTRLPRRLSRFPDVRPEPCAEQDRKPVQAVRRQGVQCWRKAFSSCHAHDRADRGSAGQAEQVDQQVEQSVAARSRNLRFRTPRAVRPNPDRGACRACEPRHGFP